MWGNGVIVFCAPPPLLADPERYLDRIRIRAPFSHKQWNKFQKTPSHYSGDFPYRNTPFLGQRPHDLFAHISFFLKKKKHIRVLLIVTQMWEKGFFS